MQQNGIESDINCEDAPRATIQVDLAIEFTVKWANDIYLNFTKSRLHVIVKFKKGQKNIDANRAAPINFTLHSMFREIGLELNGRNVGDTIQLYPTRSVLKSLLTFAQRCKKLAS